MAANPSPVRISAPMWRFWQEFSAFEPLAELGGIYANKPGYHNYRANLPSTDYSVEEVALDREGSSQYACAIDVTLPPMQMARYSIRLDAAMRRHDPRLFIDGQPVMREFIGTLNNTIVYCYMMIGGKAQGARDANGNLADEGVDWGRDRSHLEHIHGSIIRKFSNTWRAFSGILSILKNEALGDWEFSMPTAEEIAKAVWEYDVDPGVGSQTAYGAVFTSLLRDGAQSNKQLPDVLSATGRIEAALATVPTAADNADATVAKLGGLPLAELSAVLHDVLGPARTAELKEIL